jgi:hypothetical protein
VNQSTNKAARRGKAAVKCILCLEAAEHVGGVAANLPHRKPARVPMVLVCQFNPMQRALRIGDSAAFIHIVATKDIKPGQLRLLEVDNRIGNTYIYSW